MNCESSIVQLRRTVISKSIDKQPEIEEDNIIRLPDVSWIIIGRSYAFIMAINIYRVTSTMLRSSSDK